MRFSNKNYFSLFCAITVFLMLVTPGVVFAQGAPEMGSSSSEPVLYCGDATVRQYSKRFFFSPWKLEREYVVSGPICPGDASIEEWIAGFCSDKAEEPNWVGAKTCVSFSGNGGTICAECEGLRIDDDEDGERQSSVGEVDLIILTLPFEEYDPADLPEVCDALEDFIKQEGTEVAINMGVDPDLISHCDLWGTDYGD